MKSSSITLLIIVLLLAPGISGAQSSGNTITVGSTGASYSTIQSGYNAAVTGNTIEVQAGTYVGNDDFNNNISVALIGGYTNSFSTDSSNSAIAGTLTISNGTVTVENITINPPPISPTLVSIAVTPANPSIPLGTTQQFTATGTFSDNSTQNLTTSVTWSSSNVSVATISNTAGSNGEASSVSVGNTMIKAMSGSISGSTTLTVTPTLVSIAVTPANSSIAVGTNEQFTATGTYSDNSTQNITTSVTWTSSNTSVATVTSSGNATAVAAGTATITATITATSGSILGSTGLTVTSGGGAGTANNVLTLTVNGSTCDQSINAGYINDPCVSVKVCTPGTLNCVTINSILLDTGSFGLRVFQSLLNTVSLTPVASGSGVLAECAYFGGNTSDWGPIEIADIILGNEPAVTIPIQVIESTFPTIPRSCGPQGGNTPDTNPSEAGYNGILGVGPLVQDCGTTCVTSTQTKNYYTCSGSTCSATTVPLSQQVSNPVAFLLTDNNGLIVELPNVAAGGAASLTGSLVLGIGTQSNNTPSGVTTYPLDQEYGYFITTFSGVTYGASNNPIYNGGSLIDTGSNLLYFPTPTSGTYSGELPNCSNDVNSPLYGYFCPNSTTSFQANITGTSGSPTGTVSFQIGNFTSLTNSSNMVFGDLGANESSTFDWGLPFYFNRNVFIGFEGMSSSLGTGPYFAY